MRTNFYYQTKRIGFLLSVFLLLIICAGNAQTIKYVTVTGAGSQDGSSWGNAFAGTTLGSTILSCSSGDQVWVAAGTYIPSGTLKTSTFRMKAGVSVYGGFSGTEASIDDRTDFELGGANQTILDGDINVSGDNADNCYAVVTFEEGGSIDGFIIKDAYSNIESGGGINITKNTNSGYTISISNCHITQNEAASGYTSGLHVYPRFNSNSDISIENTKFTGNTGGKTVSISTLDNTQSISFNVSFDNCEISANSGDAALYASGSTSGYGVLNLGLANTLVEDNSCTASVSLMSVVNLTMTGSGFNNNSAVAKIVHIATNSNVVASNCEINGNSLTSTTATDAVLLLDNCTSEISNLTVSENTTVTAVSAIRLYNGTYTVEKTKIQSNSGAMTVWADKSSGTFENCLFSGNSVSGSAMTPGSAVFVRSYSGTGTTTVDFINCTFSANKTTQSVGVISSQTFSGHVVEIGLYNCLLWRNLNSQGESGTNTSLYMTGAGTNTSIIEYSLLQGKNPTGTGNLDGTTTTYDPSFLIEADPATAPTNAGDFRLHINSPVIDMGTATGTPTDDINGVARPVGSGIDLGAYEGGYRLIKYVNVAVSGGTGSGDSWENAMSSLQDALAINGVEEIWVAQGTYLPTTGADRAVSFVMKEGTSVYGGFEGNETSVDQRNPELYETILSGNIGDGGLTSDNSYHVVLCSTTATEATVLDGFIIEGGNANGSAPNNQGGGINLGTGSQMTISNCIIRNNLGTIGPGMYIRTATVEYCTIENNITTSSFGGGAFITGSSGIFRYNDVNNNTATKGGGVYFSACNTDFQFYNNSIYNNTATTSGGGVCLASSGIELTNNTIAFNNSNGVGGGIEISNSSPVLTNNTIAYNHSDNDIVSGVTLGGGVEVNNAASNPVFKNNLIANNYSGSGTSVTSDFMLTTGALTDNGYNLVEISNGYSWTGTGDITGEQASLDLASALSGDPMVITLGSSSVAINTGSSVANGSVAIPVYDQRGLNRTGNVDIGSVEHNGYPTLVLTNGIVYITPDGRGLKDGSSWENAMPGNKFYDTGANWYSSISWVNKAIYDAPANTQFWFSKGTYYVVGDGNREKSYTASSTDKLYGGFAGYETSTNQRQNYGIGEENETIISGDVDGVADDYSNFPNNLGTTMEGNSKRIINLSSDLTDCVIDGITFSGAYNVDGGSGIAGGMYAVPTAGTLLLNDCRFRFNHVDRGAGVYMAGAGAINMTYCIVEYNIGYQGAGVSSSNGSVNTIIDHSTFRNNISTSAGGAFMIGASPMTIQNSTIESNIAPDGAGFRLTTNSGAPTILTNNTIVYNETTGSGAAISTNNANIILTNNTIVYNVTDADDNGSGIGAVLLSSVSSSYTTYLKNNLMAENYCHVTSPIASDLYKSGSLTIASNGGNIIESGFAFVVGSGDYTGEQAGLNIATALEGNNPQYIRVLSGSIAINNGLTGTNESVNVPSVDQRGYTRLGNPDIGAFEYLAPNITVQPQDTYVCTGGSASFSVTAEGLTPMVYTWYYSSDGSLFTVLSDGGIYSGSTTETLSLSNTTGYEGSFYKCEVSNSEGFVVSEIVQIFATPQTNIITQPVGGELCINTNLTLSVAAEGGNLNYQWYLDSSPVPGATSDTYTFNTTTAGSYDLMCLVTGDCGSPVYSNIVTVNVGSPLVFNNIPDDTKCPGGTKSFFADAYGSITGYQWKKNGTILTNGGNISGATTNTLSISNITSTDEGTYSCYITSYCGNEEKSAVLTVGEPTVINTQPAGDVICEGDDYTFSIDVTATDQTYQWYKNGTPISGATSSDYMVSGAVLSDAGSYSCQVNATCGNLASDIADLVVNHTTAISNQPAGSHVCPGSDYIISIVAVGADLEYQWYKDEALMSGEESSSLVISNATSSDAGVYSCQVSGACGSVESNDAEIIIDAITDITGQPTGNIICQNNSHTFSVVASGMNLQYQWMHGAVNIGGNTASLIITNAQVADAGNYTCVVSGTCGQLTTNVATLEVIATTAITVEPQGQTVCSGGSVSFEVETQGQITSWQWYKGGIPISDGGNISGTATSVLTISNASATDENVYYCDITGVCGNASTQSVTLTINENLVLGTIAGQQLCVGNNAVFQVVTNGSNPVYQWKKDGVNLVDGGNISGATTAELVISNISSADQANYSCYVSSGCGSGETNAASLTVTEYVQLTTDLMTEYEVCENGLLSLSVTTSGPVDAYQWYLNGNPIANAITDTYSILSASSADAGEYYCEITSYCNSPVSTTASLTVNDTNLTQITVELCDGDSYTLAGGAVITTSDIYTSVLANLNGCDSTVVENVIFNPAYYIEEYIEICYGTTYQLPDGSIADESGFYTSNLFTTTGCDSTIHTELNITNSIETMVSANICSGDSLFVGGAWQNVSGSYYDTLVAALGCDSVIITELYVHNYPDVDFGADDTICHNESVTLDAGNAGWYLWSDGSTGQYLTVDYASFGLGAHIIFVEAGNGSCTSADTVIITIDNCTSVGELMVDVSVSIYPNPNKGKFMLVIENALPGMNVELIDVTGKLLDSEILSQEDRVYKEFDVSGMPKGLYFLKISSSEFVKIEKVVVE